MANANQAETTKENETTKVDKDEKKSTFKPVIKRNITLPVFKPQIGVPFYLRILTPIKMGKDINPPGTPEGKRKDPAHICDVADLETGELFQFLVPAVVQGIMADEYPDESYVGVSFQFIKQAKQSGKRYHGFSIAELED